MFFLQEPSLLPSHVCLFRPCLGCGHNELGWLPWLEYGSGMILVCGNASCSTWKDVVCVLMTVGYVVISMILTSTLTSLNLTVLLYEVKWSEVAQLCPTLCDPMDCSLPGSSVHGIFQARELEWVAISFSRGSLRPRDRTWVSHIVGRCFAVWASREVLSMNCYPTLEVTVWIK